MAPAWWAVALVALLQAPTALAQAEAREAPEEMRPVVVALEALPVALASAIAEAEDHLLTDVAQRQLDETYAYVQGFTALPQGRSSLRDGEVREAYGWTEEVVVAFLALPGAVTDVETAGAACRTESETLEADRARALAESGLAGGRRLRAVGAEVGSLIGRAPAIVDLAPVREAEALLGDWTATEVASVEECLLELLARLGIDDLTFLEVRVVPDETYPTGRIRVFGGVAGASAVRVDAPGIGWTADLPAPSGAFSANRTIPRGTELRTHDLVFTAAGRTVVVPLTVAKAPVDLRVEAPGRVTEGASFLVRATATAAPGPAEVDKAGLEVRWMGNLSAQALDGGHAAFRLPTPSPERHVLEVRYPGTDILEEAVVRLEVLVVSPDTAAAMQAVDKEMPPRDFVSRLADRLADLPWWILALALLALALAAAAVARKALKARPRLPAAAGPPRAEPFPGAAGFVAAMALLFAALRRLGLVTPGRTVREWLGATQGPSVVADRFEVVRYGKAREGRPLAERGRDWVRRQWQRWVP